jgi:putative membrane protein
MKIRFASLAVALIALSFASVVYAAGPAQDADQAFVNQAAQNIMYEVEASKLAQQNATAPDVADLAVMEAHDDTLIGNGLKNTSAPEKITVPTTLDATLKQRLQQLQSKSGAEFEAAYISDMEQMEGTLQTLLAKEAANGSDNFQTFARQANLIVKRHLGALHALDAS